MINELFDFIKNNSQEEIINNPAIPNEMNNQVMEEASNSLLDGLRGFDQNTLNQLQAQAANGQISAEQPEVAALSNNLTNNLTSKLGLNSNAAKSLALMIVPILLKKLLSNKSSNTNSGGGILDSILGGFLGGNQNSTNTQSSNGGLLDNLSDIGSKLGLDKNGDGKVDLNDLGGFFKK